MNTNLPTTPAFVRNIISVDITKWIWVLAGLLGLVVWYALLYLLGWNYCRKHGYAKWIWTTLIAFGPNSIFLVPTYLIYAVYLFRPYLFRFIRRGVDEYNAYDSNYAFKEEVQSPSSDQSSDSIAQE
ncbi:MAG: hypothetical protein K9L74_00745 [Candidatus Izimaplasma sp.]|nr:hypothetical protein [Candidatus Izimaplasma bacterium]